jgi:SNF2 family DNA or RNA helicase
MQELWALLSFTQPEAFLDKEQFLADYSELKEMTRVEALYGRLRPYVLRRMKSDVEKDLPPKEEVIVEVEMTSVQKKYYRATYERNFK